MSSSFSHLSAIFHACYSVALSCCSYYSRFLCVEPDMTTSQEIWIDQISE